MTFRCANGCEVEIGLSKSKQLHRCEKHGLVLRYAKGLGQNREGKSLKRSGFRRQNESPAERAARQEFHRVVCRSGCWAERYRECGKCEYGWIVHPPSAFDIEHGESRRWHTTCPDCHRCDGPLDSHHLLPASWVRQHFADLPEDELLAILYSPLLGASVCRSFHEQLENRSALIYYDELEPELLDWLGELEERYPGRPSLLGRLEIESPKRVAVRA